MSPHEILEHTADAKLRATGKTLDEAFSSVVQALTEIAAGKSRVVERKTATISLEAKDLKRLLFDFIDAIIYNVDTENFLPSKASDLAVTQEDGGYTLRATLVGDDAKSYGGNLKAATYSDMRIEQKGQTWLLEAVVDI
jgi:SHS2 domain-containing protein